MGGKINVDLPSPMKLLALMAASVASLAVPAAGASSSPRQLRVAFVTARHISPAEPGIWGEAYRSFVRAVRDLDVEGRVIEVGPAGETSALALAARQKYDLIIAMIRYPESVEIAARRFPSSRFLLPDGPLQMFEHPPTNIAGGWFRVEEGGYLAGYLAALMERRDAGRDAVVGSVGGFSFATVDPFIAGYQAGARRAVPDVTTVNEWARSFTQPAKCRAAALGEIADGAGVVFPVAGLCGFGALEAAKEQGVWGIGVDVDQSYLGPHILTSVVKRIDLAVYGAVQRLVNGTFRTGVNTVFDLKNGGVGLGRISPKVPPRLRIRLEKIRRAIVAGKIDVPDRLKPDSRG